MTTSISAVTFPRSMVEGRLPLTVLGTGSMTLRLSRLLKPASSTRAGGFLYFAYPPPIAATYGLFAGIEYRWSYLLHTALMGLALWGAVRMARPFVPVADRYTLATFGVALASYPPFRAVIGGQNTALTPLLLVGVAELVDALG